MALKTDYKDDVLDTSVNTQRKYKMIQNDDGTVSFEDVTEYLQTGDSFGAQEMNELVGRVLTFTNVAVPTSAWVSGGHPDFPYYADVSCQGVTENHMPNVVFDVEDSTSGIFCPVCQSYSNVVRIFASEIPSADMTISSIQCIKS